MAGRAGAIAAAFGLDARHLIGGCTLHDGATAIDFYGLLASVRLDKNNACHASRHLVHRCGSIREAFDRNAGFLPHELFPCHVFSGIVNCVDGNNCSVLEIEQRE